MLRRRLEFENYGKQVFSMTRHKLLMTWTLAALLSACGMQREALVMPELRPPFDDGLVVRKSVREMDRVEGGRVVRTYRIALGENPIGPKPRGAAGREGRHRHEQLLPAT
jgi:hypothetical protein